MKYRRLADQLQEISFRIFCSAIDANTEDANTQKGREKRYQHKTNIIADCIKIDGLIEYCLRAKMISSATAAELIEMESSIKAMTTAWRKTA